ncbi:Histone-lysine N-methyltransferase SETD1 [Spironucleus salmonicida]|uniref:Histone-lysine N-methyltransferase SETD1 n=1 Tax=Spironucleus salmonicida TaxID=348837 RepID=V6LBB0_9EUKA|nr:Histone-lysine N-methyltransferase SETD1 [Spironucleus salmonicida]|eukprot:EST41730.1 SET domain-containing protein [Spironucleus salmonicida]
MDSDSSEVETTVFDFISYQPQKEPDFSTLFNCVLPEKLTRAFFEQTVRWYPQITCQLLPRILPGVPFEPLQLTADNKTLIQNNKVLTSQESKNAPTSLNLTSTLQFEAYVPRFRVEDDDTEDEFLPNFAQSFRSRYNFQLFKEVDVIKEKIYRRETYDQGWKFALYQASIVQMKCFQLSEDELFWLNLLKERKPINRQKQMSEYVKTCAIKISRTLIKLVKRNKILDIEKRLLQFDFKHLIKECSEYKTVKDVKTIQLQEKDYQLYTKYIKECLRYRDILLKTPRPVIDQKQGDAIYQQEYMQYHQIKSQQEELFTMQNQRNEALNYITEVYIVQKAESTSKRLQTECIKLDIEQLYSKHPNSQPDEYFYNKPPYPKQLPKIITSSVTDEQTIQLLQQNKRLFSIFNRPVSQLQLTAFYHSQYHGFGLYSLKNDSQQEQISEYCGEVINSTLSEIRDKEYLKNGFHSIYMFSLRQDVIIDATFTGSYARFLNHSCTANAQSCSMYLHDNKLVPNNKSSGEPIGIGMYGVGVLGQEMTLDYNLQKVSYDKKMPCLCGSENCTGHIN